VTLSGDGKFEITQSKYRLTEEQKQEDGQKLFDFCVECIKTFIESNIHNVDEFVDGARIPLGFTVSCISSKIVELPLFFTWAATVLLPCIVSLHLKFTR
jgi:hexokinase